MKILLLEHSSFGFKFWNRKTLKIATIDKFQRDLKIMAEL